MEASLLTKLSQGSVSCFERFLEGRTLLRSFLGEFNLRNVVLYRHPSLVLKQADWRNSTMWLNINISSLPLFKVKAVICTFPLVGFNFEQELTPKLSAQRNLLTPQSAVHCITATHPVYCLPSLPKAVISTFSHLQAVTLSRQSLRPRCTVAFPQFLALPW